MASHELENEFLGIVAGLELRPTPLQLKDLPHVEAAGRTYVLNAFEGEDIRCALLAAFNRASREVSASHTTMMSAGQTPAQLIAQTMCDALTGSDLREHVGQPLAITGRGLFSTARDGETNRKVLPLAGSQVLLGDLDGAAHGPYAWATEEEILRYENEDDVRLRWLKDFGGLVVLNNVLISEIGSVHEYVDFPDHNAVVPIHVRDFEFFRAYELE